MLGFNVEVPGRIFPALWTVGEKQFRSSGLKKGDWVCYTNKAVDTGDSTCFLCVRERRDLWASSWFPVYQSTTTDSAPSEASSSRFENPRGGTGLSFAVPGRLLSLVMVGGLQA